MIEGLLSYFLMIMYSADCDEFIIKLAIKRLAIFDDKKPLIKNGF